MVGTKESNIHMDTRISNENLLILMRLLKKYLMDDSVEIIDLASQALQVSLLMYHLLLPVLRSYACPGFAFDDLCKLAKY